MTVLVWWGVYMTVGMVGVCICVYDCWYGGGVYMTVGMVGVCVYDCWYGGGMCI